MKQVLKLFYLSFTILLLTPLIVMGQTNQSRDSLNNKITDAARELINSAGNCSLITIDHEGNPRARVMDPFLPEKDFIVWFGTNSKSRKINEIKKNPKVALYYFDKDRSGYVLINGIAQIVDDQKEKDLRWKKEWEAFYPNRSESYVLIKVSPKRMEVISYAHGIFGDSLTWEVPAVLFD